jgi:hypothetical protein
MSDKSKICLSVRIGTRSTLVFGSLGVYCSNEVCTALNLLCLPVIIFIQVSALIHFLEYELVEKLTNAFKHVVVLW